jgi:hypothetical protein
MKIIIILAVIILAVVAFLFYMGMFSKIVVKEEQKGPYTFAIVEHKGPYSGVGKPMAELDKKMRAAGFNSKDGIGLYYDDPAKVSKNQLKSEVGYLITKDDLGKVQANQGKFNFRVLEQENFLVAEFPIRNMLSYMFGPMKVYPVVNAFLREKGLTMTGASIEIYDMSAKKIYFLIRAGK